ncbi:MAG: hypothetical protein JRN37_06660 [Nitrososphaerota archaeon]|jgi:hypothetical protein|nr:hypothetical protein [Nitrososphaerota archaeon]MDG7038818.1 hypothetical protein [Nitrososphaerota archaeon]
MPNGEWVKRFIEDQGLVGKYVEVMIYSYGIHRRGLLKQYSDSEYLIKSVDKRTYLIPINQIDGIRKIRKPRTPWWVKNER